MNFTINTPSGYWNPILWLLVFILFALLAILIYTRGNPKYKKNTEQVKPYLSGNLEPGKERVQVRAGDMYWGLVEALKGYYRVLQGIHTGDIRDYILWYIGIAAIITVILLGGM